MIGKIRRFGSATLVCLLIGLFASASHADDAGDGNKKLDQIITKLQKVTKSRTDLTLRKPTSDYSELVHKSRDYTLNTQQLERLIARINAYAGELKEKASAGTYDKRDVKRLRGFFRQLSNSNKAVKRSLRELAKEVKGKGTSSAAGNVKELAGVIKSNVKELEELIASITKKRTEVSAEDFDALIELTKRQKSDEVGQIVTSSRDLRNSPPVTQTSEPALTSGEILAAMAPPEPSDLTETVEVKFTPEVNELAASLNNSPVEIYEYVRNNVAFELYFGSRKGASATLLTKAGNDYDQASLMLALLRTSGISARYVRGTVEVPVQRVMDWLGLKDENTANTILNTAGISATPVVGTGGSVEVYRIDRVWVAAYVPYNNYRGTETETTGSIWVPLDPAFNVSDYQAGVDNVTDSVIFDEAVYLSTARTDTAADFYRDQMFDHLATNMPGTSLVDVPYSGTVLPEQFGILPGSLPYTVRSIETEFSEIPGALRHAVRVNVSSGSTLFETNLLLPEVALNRRTISFVGATAADQATIDGYGGIANTPPYLVNVKPQLKLDGVLAIEGSAISLGAGVTVSIGFIEPESGETGSVSHPFLNAGDYISVNLDVGQTTQELVIYRSEQLLNAIETIGTPVPDAQQDEVIGELLNIGGMLYWLRMNDNNKLVSDLYHYKEVIGVSESLTTSNMDVLYLFDRAYAAVPGNLSLDAARLMHNRFSIDGDESDKANLNRVLGFESSAREHAMWEELVSVESISTIKALQVANQQGIPIHRFDSSSVSDSITCSDSSVGTVLTCMARCGVPSSTRSAISTEISSGNEITTHECQVTLNQWQGLGYVSADPVTQSGAYIISGGLHSYKETGAETTIGGINPIEQLTNSVGNAVLGDLPSHIINQDNIDSLLPTLQLPTSLIEHVQALVAEGNTATLSEVVVELAGLESLVFKLESSALDEAAYYRFDTLAGGSGTEDPPGSTGDPDGNTGNGDGTGQAGDPVNIANGSFYREERDFAITALGYPLAFDRFYNSGLTDDGSLGIGWTHTYSDSVFENGDGSVNWTRTTGGVYTFEPDGSGGYITPDGIDSTLVKTGTGFTLTSKKLEVQEFNTVGQMVSRKNSLGQGFDLTYTGGLLTKITDTSSLSRTIDITYNADDKISTVTDFTGRSWDYSYTGGMLSRVESPSDAQTLAMVTEYTYYTGPLSQNLLRTITEPNGGTLRVSYYTNDRVFQVKDTEGYSERFSYDILTNTTIYTDQRGNKTRYRHNDDGNIVEIRYADGSRERWVWSNHQVVSHRDTLGHTETYQYDSNRNLIEHVDREGVVTTYTYDPVTSVKTQMTRPGGRVMDYSFDSSGSLRGISDSEGGSYTTGPLNALGLPELSTDPRGVQTATIYNEIGQPTNISTPGEWSTSIGYSPRGKIINQTDANGHGLIQDYDLLDRLIRHEDAEGNETFYEYDQAGRLTKIINPRSYETTFEYDLKNRLVKQTDALSNSIIHVFDGSGNVIEEIDRLGRSTQHVYDNRNRRVQTTYPTGAKIEMEYDSESRLVGFVDPLGNLTKYDVDGEGRITDGTDALSNSYHQDYDTNGNVRAVTNRRGGYRELEYDDFNRVTKITDEGGFLKTFDYDGAGNVTQIARYDIDGLGTVPADPRSLPDSRKRTVDIQYDVRGLPERITDPEGNDIVYTRDDKGNIQTYTDQRNKQTTYQYDQTDRLKKIIQHDLTEIDLSYDENDNLTYLRNPNGGSWSWTYDELDRVSSETDPLSRTTTFEYDAVGNLTKRTNHDGSYVSYKYDGVNRRIHTARSDGSYTTKVYDSAGNMVFGETDKTLLISNYDALNRLQREITQIPLVSFTKTVTYGYDQESNLTGVVLPESGNITYGYDLADRLESVINSRDGSSIVVGYNGFGERSSVTYGNGTSGVYTYDKNGKIVGVNYGGSIASSAYIRDQVGNPSTINETIGGVAETLSIVYDDLNRPVTSTATNSSARSETFAYDDNGNLIDTGDGDTAVYDSADQIIYDGIATYKNDTQGNISSRDILGGVLTDYTYDPENKLIHVKQSNGSTVTNEFANVYDARGRLISTSVNGNPINRIHAGLNPLVDYNPDNSVNMLYTTGSQVDDVYAVSVAGVQHYLHLDPMGSIRASTDSSGIVSGTKDYGVFGRLLNETGSSGILLGYVGRPFDPQTGLIDMRARWMNPEIARFTSRDPLPLRPAVPNPYLYADNQPLNFIDPLGLSPESPEDSWLDDLQFALDMFGLIPGIGEFADGANALIYLARGDYVNAALSGAAMLPIGGQAATAAKMANKGADAVKGMDKANDARKMADNLPSCSGGKCDGGMCFLQDTEVITADGEIPIQDVKIGDKVWAYNHESGLEELRTVTTLYKNTKSTLVIIYAGSEVIESTPEHPFWVVGKRWVDAGDLKVGDPLITKGGNALQIDKIKYKQGSFPVYNLEVDGLHNYYVSREHILVHNTCEKTYETYTKTHPETNDVYSGRTSGTGTPEQNVANRDAGHHMNDKGYGPAVLDKSSTNKDAIRGREQQNIDANGGAQSQGGTSGNAINGIADSNPNRDHYINQANQEFGGQ